MVETAERARLAQLESLGDAMQFAGRIHSLITFSPLFENFNLAEVDTLSQFMQVYRAEPGVEIIRESEAGDFMVFLPAAAACVERRCSGATLAQDRLPSQAGSSRSNLRADAATTSSGKLRIYMPCISGVGICRSSATTLRRKGMTALH